MEAVTETEVPSLMALARQALNESGGNQHNARLVLIERIYQDPVLSDAHFKPLLEQAVQEALSRVQRLANAQIREALEAPVNPTMPHNARLRWLARANLMNYRLSNGTPVSDASRGDLVKDGDFHIKQGRTMLHTGRWMRLVGQHLPNGKIVRQAMNEERLHELWKESENDDNG